MSIDEMLQLLTLAKEELGGNTEVLRYNYRSTDGFGVIRISGMGIQTAVIEDLGSGVAGWTLDEDKPGTKVISLLLD